MRTNGIHQVDTGQIIDALEASQTNKQFHIFMLPTEYNGGAMRAYRAVVVNWPRLIVSRQIDRYTSRQVSWEEHS